MESIMATNNCLSSISTISSSLSRITQDLGSLLHIERIRFDLILIDRHSQLSFSEDLFIPFHLKTKRKEIEKREIKKKMNSRG